MSSGACPCSNDPEALNDKYDAYRTLEVGAPCSDTRGDDYKCYCKGTGNCGTDGTCSAELQKQMSCGDDDAAAGGGAPAADGGGGAPPPDNDGAPSDGNLPPAITPGSVACGGTCAIKEDCSQDACPSNCEVLCAGQVCSIKPDAPCP